MTLNEWFFPRGTLSSHMRESVVDSQSRRLQYAGLEIADLREGQAIEFPPSDLERLVIPLSGSFQVTYYVGNAEKRIQHLEGRQSVFDGPTDTLYLPIGSKSLIQGSGRVAIAGAKASGIYPVAYVPREQVRVEMRGKGSASRQVHNFGTPSNLEASRLIACEVITPAGNWSSYPPHKHDEHIPGVETPLEEIYYFEVAVQRGTMTTGKEDPIGYMRNYGSKISNIETLAEVRTGDIALVPAGYHGPCMAAPGYDLYYLNVMAGPSSERAWLISDDPAHAWVRETWNSQSLDPRLPYLREES